MNPVAKITPEPKNLQGGKKRQVVTSRCWRAGARAARSDSLGEFEDAAGHSTSQERHALRYDREERPDERGDLQKDAVRRITWRLLAAAATHEDDEEPADAQAEDPIGRRARAGVAHRSMGERRNGKKMHEQLRENAGWPIKRCDWLSNLRAACAWLLCEGTEHRTLDRHRKS